MHRLGLRSWCLRCVGEEIVILQEDAIGPAEPDDVALIARRYSYVGGSFYDVVFLSNRMIVQKILQNDCVELRRESLSVLRETVLRQSFYCKPVCGCPSVG